MAMQEVLKNISAEIADMGVRVYGRAACIKLNLRRSDRGELFYLAAIGVVELDGHRILEKQNRRIISVRIQKGLESFTIDFAFKDSRPIVQRIRQEMWIQVAGCLQPPWLRFLLLSQ